MLTAPFDTVGFLWLPSNQPFKNNKHKTTPCLSEKEPHPPCVPEPQHPSNHPHIPLSPAKARAHVRFRREVLDGPCRTLEVHARGEGELVDVAYAHLTHKGAGGGETGGRAWVRAMLRDRVTLWKKHGPGKWNNTYLIQ